MIAAVVANCHRDPKKSKPFRPEDFMPFVEKAKAEPQDIEAQFMAFAKAWNEALPEA